MIAFVLRVCHICVERMPERRFPTQDQPRQIVLFHGAHPALCMSMQMRRPWWQGHPRAPSLSDDLLKRGAELRVPVMDQVLSRGEAAPRLPHYMVGTLHHPHCIGMRRDARHGDLPLAQMQ